MADDLVAVSVFGYDRKGTSPEFESLWRSVSEGSHSLVQKNVKIEVKIKIPATVIAV